MKKLTILGTGVSCKDPDWTNDIWATGSCFADSYADKTERIDLGFELHKVDVIRGILDKKKVQFDYNRYKTPSMVQSIYDDWSGIIDDVREFPLEDMIKYVKGRKFFTSTFAYMIVYAAMQGYKEIELNRILLSFDHEYLYEMPCIEYWCNILTQTENIHFSIPEDSEIYSNHKLYGYEPKNNAKKVQSRLKYVWHNFNERLMEYEKLLGENSTNYAIIDTLNWIRTQPDVKQIEEAYNEAKRRVKNDDPILQGIVNSLNEYRGALQLSYFYENLID
jgi:hypothetical protein